MVSQMEGHTSGVCDLFSQTPLLNCRVQLVVPLFVKNCFQKCSLSLMQIGVTLFLFSLSLLFCLSCCCFFFKMKQTTFQGNGKHSCMPRKGKTFLTRRRQQWSLPELHFRAPSKETASNRQSWQGEGGPGMKGRAGIMVNLRVKHATRG